jgi:hypothetical protein
MPALVCFQSSVVGRWDDESSLVSAGSAFGEPASDGGDERLDLARQTGALEERTDQEAGGSCGDHRRQAPQSWSSIVAGAITLLYPRALVTASRTGFWCTGEREGLRRSLRHALEMQDGFRSMRLATAGRRSGP